MDRALYVFEKIAKKNKTVNDLLTGAVAGTIATAATMPLEIIQINQATKERQPVLNIVKQIYKTEGLPGFYKGLSTKILKVAPTMGLTFATYELLKDWNKK